MFISQRSGKLLPFLQRFDQIALLAGKGYAFTCLGSSAGMPKQFPHGSLWHEMWHSECRISDHTDRRCVCVGVCICGSVAQPQRHVAYVVQDRW